MPEPVLTASQRKALFLVSHGGRVTSTPAVRLLVRHGWLTEDHKPTEKAARLFRDRQEAEYYGEARAMLHRVREHRRRFGR